MRFSYAWKVVSKMQAKYNKAKTQTRISHAAAYHELHKDNAHGWRQDDRQTF